MIGRFLISLKHTLRKLYDFSRAERRDLSDPGTKFRPGMLANGFFSQRARIYPLDHFDRCWFLSDWELMFGVSLVNGPVPKSQFNNKLFYHLSMRAKGFTDQVPTLIGLFTPNGFTSYSEYAKLEDAMEYHPRVILKPVEGNAGSGIFLIGKDAVEKGLRVQGSYLVESAVPAHPYAWRIFPAALNTVRVSMLRDPDTKRFFIVDGVHRFGTKESAPADNFSKGGLCSLINSETGELSAAKRDQPKFADEKFDKHPNTGVRIEGTVVPRWNEVRELILRVSESFPDLLIVCWDLAITPEGICIIESNAGTPAITLSQIHRPLLLDARVRRFMAHHRVITRRRAEDLERRARKKKS